MNDHDRMELIAVARNLDGEAFDEAIRNSEGPGRYEQAQDRELAMALETIAGHGFADDQHENYSLIGPCILIETSQGFIIPEEYESADQAAAAFELIYA